MRIESKLPQIGTTIFTVMSQLAADCQALNLSQGFPDFDVPADLTDLVHYHMKKGHNQYAPMPGLPILRQNLSRKVSDLYDYKYNPESEVTITAGGTEALFSTITATVRPGDEVLIIEPAFDAYVPAVLLSGGVPKFVKLQLPDFSINWDDVARKVTPTTRLLILNSPHNPTGSIYSMDDLKALAAISRRSNFFILSDEVYEHMTYDGCQHLGMASLPELARRSFVVGSFGKTFNATGWKVGYCLAPADLTREIRRIHQFVTFAVNTPIQHAIAQFMETSDWQNGLGAFYQIKRDHLRNLLAVSRFKMLPCHGTYFMMADYSEISDKPDKEFAEMLTRNHGVATIPLSVFYHDQTDNKIIRFCFAKPEETLEAAAKKLCVI